MKQAAGEKTATPALWRFSLLSEGEMTQLVVPDLRTRPSRTAQEFMKRKGYNLRPVHFQKILDQDVWYYYYDLDEGLLELEVEQGPWDNEGIAKVTAFRHGSHQELLTQ